MADSTHHGESTGSVASPVLAADASAVSFSTADTSGSVAPTGANSPTPWSASDAAELAFSVRLCGGLCWARSLSGACSGRLGCLVLDGCHFRFRCADRCEIADVLTGVLRCDPLELCPPCLVPYPRTPQPCPSAHQKSPCCDPHCERPTPGCRGCDHPRLLAVMIDRRRHQPRDYR